jgi:hypothetical protein
VEGGNIYGKGVPGAQPQPTGCCEDQPGPPGARYEAMTRPGNSPAQMGSPCRRIAGYPDAG